jgi:hypothetical protein
MAYCVTAEENDFNNLAHENGFKFSGFESVSALF